MMNATYRAAWAIVPKIPLPSGKLAESLRGRRHAAARWVEWAADHQASGPTVWVHAASVGEALAVQPILRRLRAALPCLRIVHTHTSPSVTRWPAPFGADHSDYAPADHGRAVSHMLDALRPSLLLFSRGDLWPVLVASAESRGIPVAVAGGVVNPKSHRLLAPVRAALRSIHDRIAFVGANSPEDANRWERLGTPKAAIHVAGDPREDAVLEHVPDLARVRGLATWAAQQPVMIAGSTEPSDEHFLLQGFALTSTTHPKARLLLVPHEPDKETIARVESLTRRLGIAATRWTTDDGAPNGSCVVVSQLGLLADLYALGDFAYVGGGFGSSGIHSVTEPAAYGLPVVVGPRATESATVAGLIRVGGGVALPRRDPAREFAAQWNRWLDHEEQRTRMGLAARRWLSAGAAATSAARLLELIQAGQPTG